MKTVLAPIDFSKVSRRVVNTAVDLARLLQARVVLLHAVSAPAADLAALASRSGRLPKTPDRAARKHLARWQRELAEHRIAVATRCATGVPAVAILRAAGEVRANFIVLGPHGHRVSEPRTLGTTAGGVLAGASCPVVVIPAPRPRRKRAK